MPDLGDEYGPVESLRMISGADVVSGVDPELV
jgi:hypothetical protein